jgi:hypothetical protein
MTPPPVFRTCKCGMDAMPNSSQCCACRNIDLGWDYDEAVYRKPERLLFDAPVNDPTWDDACAAITQDADPIRMAG